MAARATASGTITFGLVSVPIKVYTATSSKNVSFNMLHDKDKSRLKQQYVCTLCGEVVERSHMAKGYEHAKDQYVVINEDELAGMLRKTDQSIEILEFVPITDVDPVYFEKSQLLGPDKGGAKPYALLMEAMKQSGKVAIGRFSTRGKEQLVLIRPSKEGLMLHGLYYHDEVRGFEDVDLGDPKAIKEGELGLAVQLIEQLSSGKFDPARHKDDFREAMLGLLEQKIAGAELTAPAPEQPREQIIDLMEALKASLAKKQAAAPAASASDADSEEAKPKKKKAKAS